MLILGTGERGEVAGCMVSGRVLLCLRLIERFIAFGQRGSIGNRQIQVPKRQGVKWQRSYHYREGGGRVFDLRRGKRVIDPQRKRGPACRSAIQGEGKRKEALEV